MTTRYWTGDFDSVLEWLLKELYSDLQFSKTLRQKDRNHTPGDKKQKKLNEDTFIEEPGRRFFASEQGKKIAWWEN